MKTICICEKPSVARSIARVLGVTEKQEGYLSGNGYAVTWTYGHLLALALPQDYGIVHVEKEMLPIIPDPFKLVVRQIKTEDGYKADPTALKQLEVIRKLLGQADQVISCTDAGREGELIMRYVLEYLGYHKETKRLWISSMTEKSIREGFDSLKSSKEFDNLYRAAKARRESDWKSTDTGTWHDLPSISGQQGFYSQTLLSATATDNESRERTRLNLYREIWYTGKTRCGP